MNGGVSPGSNAQLSAVNGTVYVHGSVDQPQRVIGTLVQGSDVVVDPLATMSMPRIAGLAVKSDPAATARDAMEQ